MTISANQKSSTLQIGTNVKNDVVDKIINRLSDIGKSKMFLPKGEVVLGIFRASGVATNHIVITDYRIFGVKNVESYGNVVFANEIDEKDVQSITAQAIKGLFNQVSYVLEIEKDGKKSKYAKVKSTDADNIVKLIEKMKSSETMTSLIEAQGQIVTEEKADRNRIATEQKKQKEAEREKSLAAKQVAHNELKIRQKLDRQANEQAKKDAKQLVIDRTSSGQCPKCGSDNLQAISMVSGGGGSSGGCCNCCCVPGGAGQISPTKTTTARMCLNCGNKF